MNRAGQRSATHRRMGVTPVLFLLFILTPVLELWIVIQVGQRIGAGPTVLLLLAMSIAGAGLVKREGVRAWRRFRDALHQGRLPAVEVTDGALVLIGGTLLLTPGFATDVAGLLLVLPPTRSLAGRGLRHRVRSSFTVTAAGYPPRPRPTDEPIDVEVMSVERDAHDPSES